MIVDDYLMAKMVETRFNLIRQEDNIFIFSTDYKILAHYLFNHTDIAFQNQRTLFPPPQLIISYAGIYEIIDHLTRENVKLIERAVTAFQSASEFYDQTEILEQ